MSSASAFLNYFLSKLLFKKLFVILVLFFCSLLIILSYKEAGVNFFKKPIQLFKDFNVKSFLIKKQLDNCEAILQDGNFTDENLSKRNSCSEVSPRDFTNTNYDCMRKWKPNGCSMHFYYERDLERCMNSMPGKKKYIIFVGDSRVRYIYSKTVLFLGNKTLEKKFWHDSSYSKLDIQLEPMYFYQIHLNDTFFKKIKQIREITENHEAIIVIGIAIHMMLKYLWTPQLGFKEYEKYLLEARKVLEGIGSKGKVLWFLQPPCYFSFESFKKYIKNNFRYNITEGMSKKEISNLLEENNKKAMLKLQKFTMNKNQYKYMSVYNGIAEKVFNGTSVKMWHSAKYIGEQSLKDYMDNIHLSDYDNYNFMQIILNILCNKEMNFQSNFCCA